ncbi:MAG TPA: hypothetical protein VM819_11865 [Vicinamibacterales bacterium]|nr:hypothetical protein [Vicinamibacterales bacterium]
MAQHKPTGRGSSRRLGLPKESVRLTEEAPPREELPSDLSSLANILEAAMLPSPPRQRVADDAALREVVQSPPREEAVHSPLTPAPPVETTDGAQREAAAFDAVARSLAAAEACVPLLAQSTGLLRIAALDVVRAETARAGGLLQLLRFLRGDVSPPITAVSTNAVVQRVVQALESERRLRSIALTTRSSVADATCAGDETMLANTLLVLLLITFAAVEGVQNARVALSVTVSDDEEIGLAISQDHVAAPAGWTARAGSEDLSADSAQAIAVVALAAAHRLAREWHGRFAIATGEHSSILTIWLPMLQPGDSDQTPH